MSKGIAEPKLTAADAMLDKLTTTIFIFQMVVVLILGVSGNIWNNYEKRKVCTSGIIMLPLEDRQRFYLIYTPERNRILVYNMTNLIDYIVQFRVQMGSNYVSSEPLKNIDCLGQ